ncbi:hypothetical protein GCM10027262_50550 [Nocardia tengchongensis]
MTLHTYPTDHPHTVLASQPDSIPFIAKSFAGHRHPKERVEPTTDPTSAYRRAMSTASRGDPLLPAITSVRHAQALLDADRHMHAFPGWAHARQSGKGVHVTWSQGRPACTFLG